MIIIPSLKTVVVLVPRTGSGSLRLAIQKRHPDSILIYRHMEADGVPLGYDRWSRVGVVRHPLARLYSLYKFLKFGDGGSYASYPDLWKRLQHSVSVPFEDWLTQNELVFTSPYDVFGSTFWPQYSVRHPIPETRKSQFIHLRPDLGTEIIRFNDLGSLERRLDVALGNKNATDGTQPAVTQKIKSHLERFHAWDLENA